MQNATERTCRECRQMFEWTEVQAGWMQRRLAQIGASYFPPGICPRCAAEKKVREHPEYRVLECPICGTPFACPPSVRRLGAVCRACLQTGRDG
jgi:ribosomal protein S27E